VPEALVVDWAQKGSTTAFIVSPPTIMADANATNEIFAIGHRGKYKTENFDTFASFISALTADLTRWQRSPISPRLDNMTVRRTPSPSRDSRCSSMIERRAMF
jgi:hypothetical protein